jgi:hypothetical protein
MTAFIDACRAWSNAESPTRSIWRPFRREGDAPYPILPCLKPFRRSCVGSSAPATWATPVRAVSTNGEVRHADCGQNNSTDQASYSSSAFPGRWGRQGLLSFVAQDSSNSDQNLYPCSEEYDSQRDLNPSTRNFSSQQTSYEYGRYGA